MKRFLSLLMVAVLLITLVSCNSVKSGISSDSSENSLDTYSSQISGTESTSHVVDTSSVSETSSYTESADKQTETSDSLSTSSGKKYTQEEINDLVDQFSSVEKFITWINNTNSGYKYHKYKETLEAIRKEGYILEPYYKNKRFPLSKKRGYVVKPQEESDYGGHGYYFYYSDDKDAEFLIWIYYLEKEEAEDAKNNLHNYLSGVGRFGPSKYTWEERAEKGFEKSFNEVIGKEIISHRYSLSRNSYIFLYEEQYVIQILDTLDSSLTFDEFIKDLTFKKVSISQ